MGHGNVPGQGCGNDLVVVSPRFAQECISRELHTEFTIKPDSSPTCVLTKQRNINTAFFSINPQVQTGCGPRIYMKNTKPSRYPDMCSYIVTQSCRCTYLDNAQGILLVT